MTVKYASKNEEKFVSTTELEEMNRAIALLPKLMSDGGLAALTLGEHVNVTGLYSKSLFEYVLSYSIHSDYDGKCLESGYITIDTVRSKIFDHDVVLEREIKESV